MAKQLNAKEFRARGYLQEINRRVLHPLGLAMFLNVDDKGEESFGGVFDYRDDPEGVYYGFAEGSPGYRTMVEQAQRVAGEWDERAPRREVLLGFMIQPVADVDP